MTTQTAEALEQEAFEIELEAERLFPLLQAMSEDDQNVLFYVASGLSDRDIAKALNAKNEQAAHTIAVRHCNRVQLGSNYRLPRVSKILAKAFNLLTAAENAEKSGSVVPSTASAEIVLPTPSTQSPSLDDLILSAAEKVLTLSEDQALELSKVIAREEVPEGRTNEIVIKLGLSDVSLEQRHHALTEAWHLSERTFAPAEPKDIQQRRAFTESAQPQLTAVIDAKGNPVEDIALKVAQIPGGTHASITFKTLELLARGKRNQEIAEILQTSAGNIGTIISVWYEKLGVPLREGGERYSRPERELLARGFLRFEEMQAGQTPEFVSKPDSRPAEPLALEQEEPICEPDVRTILTQAILDGEEMLAKMRSALALLQT